MGAPGAWQRTWAHVHYTREGPGAPPGWVPPVPKFLIKKGSDTDFGARPLRRALENFIEDPVSEELLKGEFEGKDTIRVDCTEVAGKKQLTFTGSVTAEPVAAGPVEGGS
jgi:hypothetical protein